MPKSVVIISNDLGHDANAVLHFTELAVTHLRENQKVQMERLIEFTDGCSCQYKSKLPFADISFGGGDLGVKLERHYFGSRHGKGPSDGVSGVVKAALRRAVLSHQADIDDAKTVFQYCEENLTRTDCHSQKRKFIFVELGSVKRNREDHEVKVALAGTRVLQAVKAIEPGVIGTRLLSCFCPGCEGDGPCDNLPYTLPWQPRALKMKIPPVPHNPTDDMVEDDSTGNHGRGSVITAENQQVEGGGVMLEDNDVPIQAIWDSLQGVEAEEHLSSDGEGQGQGTDVDDLNISLNKSAMEELDIEMLDSDKLLTDSFKTTEDSKNHLDDNNNTCLLVLKPNQFYAVYLSRKAYIGKVVKLNEDGSVEIDFLEQKGANEFVWPKTKDLVPVIEKWRIFHGPIQFSGHHVLSVGEDVVKEIKKKHGILKKEYH